MAVDPSRYSRHILFPPIGVAGQERIGRASVVLVGLGAVGAACAEMLVRAGIGTLDIVDRDVVEDSNLQRQTLYDAAQAAAVMPKAVAAAARLAAIGAGTEVRPHVRDVTAASADELAAWLRGGGATGTILVDGTDSFETRYLLSDLAVREGAVLAYAGAVGSRSAAALFVPGATPCLRCLFPVPPPAGEQETCDSAGVIAPAAHAAAAHAVAMVLRHLAEAGGLGWFWSGDLWSHEGRVMELRADGRVPDCAACGTRSFPALHGTLPPVVALCGRDAFQVNPTTPGAVDMRALAARLGRLGAVSGGEHALRLHRAGAWVTVFADGRALVAGVDSAERARRIYAEVIGS